MLKNLKKALQGKIKDDKSEKMERSNENLIDAIFGAHDNQGEPKKLIFVGNPGVGKSTMLNSVAGKVIFKSGVSVGRGMTFELQKQSIGNMTFCDTPGLADQALRKQAGVAISELLKEGGCCKLFFVVTLEAGRVRPQDTATIRLILDAAPEIMDNYGIIINKCSKNMLKTLSQRKEFQELVTFLFHGIQKENQHGNIFLIEKNSDLEDAPDELVAFTQFKGFGQFMAVKVPWIKLTPGKAHDIRADEVESLREKMETNARLLKQNEKEFANKLEETERTLRDQNARREQELKKETEALKNRIERMGENKGFFGHLGAAADSLLESIGIRL